MKKVCIITASRSEYGLLRWLIDEVNNDHNLLLQLVVTGSHLSQEYGLTYAEIEKNGYTITANVEMVLSSSTQIGVVKSMGVCSIGFADVFGNLKPDIIVVLGDRYELLPICSAALVMNIPMAHISGGDITEGAIDDQVRNAVTMMATLHFPGVDESAKRIERMRGTSRNIYVVGEPGLENFKRLTLTDRNKLAQRVGLDASLKWVLLTYHPESKLALAKNLETINNIISVLDQHNDIQVVSTGANSDFGGSQINEILRKAADTNGSKFKYLSYMKEVKFIIGNSSSGIIEAPFLAKAVVNVGDRQKGRHISNNIVNTPNDTGSISNAINKAMQLNLVYDNYFGDGHTSAKIKSIIEEFLFPNQ
jgi:UDP-hydrolysing UDP-N-acetyl-D-glucosamine 2-epimerase